MLRACAETAGVGAIKGLPSDFGAHWLMCTHSVVIRAKWTSFTRIPPFQTLDSKDQRTHGHGLSVAHRLLCLCNRASLAAFLRRLSSVCGKFCRVWNVFVDKCCKCVLLAGRCCSVSVFGSYYLYDALGMVADWILKDHHLSESQYGLFPVRIRNPQRNVGAALWRDSIDRLGTNDRSCCLHRSRRWLSGHRSDVRILLDSARAIPCWAWDLSR